MAGRSELTKVRQKSSWTNDNQGKYARHIGWKLTRSGKRQQHKFRLGSTMEEAERREVRILHRWDTVERLLDSDCTFSGPLGTDVTLGWAEQMAKGCRRLGSNGSKAGLRGSTPDVC